MISKLLNYIGSIGSIGIGQFCPVCYPFIATILTAVGLGFIVSPSVLKWLLVLFLGIGIFGLLRSYRIHKNFMPLAAGALASGFIYAGRYFLSNDIVFYTGVIGLLGAVIWDMRVKKDIPCPACNGSLERQVQDERKEDDTG